MYPYSSNLLQGGTTINLAAWTTNNVVANADNYQINTSGQMQQRIFGSGGAPAYFISGAFKFQYVNNLKRGNIAVVVTYTTGSATMSYIPLENNGTDYLEFSTMIPIDVNYTVANILVQINGVDIPMFIKNLSLVVAATQDQLLDLVKQFTTLSGTVDIDKLSAQLDTINIKDLAVTNAKIADATIQGAKIALATIDTANIKNAAITNELIQDSTIMSAKIKNLDADKIDSGTINTSLVDIASEDGRMIIKNNTLLIYDYVNNDPSQPFLRIQVGRLYDIVNGELQARKDNNNNNYVYAFEVRDKDGTTVMLDGQGVHQAGITDGAINNAKVAPNANIDGTKLNIEH